MDSRTLFIKNFAYDGQGPDAYFYAGESGEPSSKGYLIANEKESKLIRKTFNGNKSFYSTFFTAVCFISYLIEIQGSKDILGAYRSKNIVLTLPGGKTLRNVKWISVWCRAFDVNFGEVTFPDR